MDKQDQDHISQLISLTGQMLLQYGAESYLVDDICIRLGKALELDEVNISLSASSMVITTCKDGHIMTSVSRCPDRGINMRIVTEIQRILIMTEKQLLDKNDVQIRLKRISTQRYNRWLVAVMIAISCACFSRLSGGDLSVFILTSIASFVGIVVRQEIISREFNPFLCSAITAFVTTLVASIGAMLHIGNNPYLIMASSVLLLVPGFPLINAVSDMVKGYINMGIARWLTASLLTLATCLGIVGAMNFTGIWGWL